MKRHTRNYMDAMGYDNSDWIPCELCEREAVDIHHIEARGMGGNPKGDKDEIENLMALCRGCHEDYGDKSDWKQWLKDKHTLFRATKQLRR